MLPVPGARHATNGAALHVATDVAAPDSNSNTGTSPRQPDAGQGEDSDPCGVRAPSRAGPIQGSITVNIGTKIIAVTRVANEIGALGQVHVKVIVVGCVELGGQNDVEDLAGVHLPSQFV